MSDSTNKKAANALLRRRRNLTNEMVAQKARPADLARLMGIKHQEVNRIINLERATKVDTLAAAFEALGRELDVVVR